MADNQPKNSGGAIHLSPNDATSWAHVVGSLILLFGSAELISLGFIGKLSGHAARDAAMRLKFSDRIKEIKRLIKKSYWKDNEKSQALKLWSEVAEKSKIRNTVAHNPWTGGQSAQGKFVCGILNIRDLKGSGPYSPTLIQLHEIALAHNRMQELVSALKVFVKPT